MKHLLTFIAAALIGTSATAGGLAPPVETAPPSAPPTVSRDWSGPYVGGFYGGQSTTETVRHVETETEIPETEVQVTDECEYLTAHSGGAKCIMPKEASVATFGDLPDCGHTYGQTCIVNHFRDGTVRVFVPGAERGDTLEYYTGETVIEYGEPIVTKIVSFFETVSEGERYGAFIGNRWDMGGYVVGAELAGTSEGMYTLEGTAGYDMGDLLPYVSAGLATDGDHSGWTAGVGADYRVTDSMSIGAKYSFTDVDAYTVEAVDLRVSFTF